MHLKPELRQGNVRQRLLLIFDDRECVTLLHIRLLPRKEVVHPQLPLRMPCYDFAPIIDPTFYRYAPVFGYYRLS